MKRANKRKIRSTRGKKDKLKKGKSEKNVTRCSVVCGVIAKGREKILVLCASQPLGFRLEFMTVFLLDFFAV